MHDLTVKKVIDLNIYIVESKTLGLKRIFNTWGLAHQYVRKVIQGEQEC